MGPGLRAPNAPQAPCTNVAAKNHAFWGDAQSGGKEPGLRAPKRAAGALHLRSRQKTRFLPVETEPGLRAPSGALINQCRANKSTLLVVRLDVSRLLVIPRQLFLDLGAALQVVRVGLDLLGLNDLLEALTDAVVGRRLQVASLDQLDDMPAVLRLNRLPGVLAGLQREDGF